SAASFDRSDSFATWATSSALFTGHHPFARAPIERASPSRPFGYAAIHKQVVYDWRKKPGKSTKMVRLGGPSRTIELRQIRGANAGVRLNGRCRPPESRLAWPPPETLRSPPPRRWAGGCG